MMEKLSGVEIWKLRMVEKVELETIEATLAQACREVMEKAYPEGPYGMIERVDMREKETIIFVSGNERTAKAFSKTLGARVPRVNVTITKVSQADIMKFT